MTLEQIIAQAKSGSRKHQRLMFDLTSDQMKSVAMRYVPDSNLAEDVLQESYIRIFKHLDNFNYINDAAFYGWMSRITANEAIRQIKKDKRWNDLNNQVQPKLSVQSPLFNDDLFRVLLTLPTQQRLVFNMHALEGYSHKEIANQLGMAESSSRSLLTRARAHLQLQITKFRAYENV